jgi:small subunit ribosomal protein S1
MSELESTAAAVEEVTAEAVEDRAAATSEGAAESGAVEQSAAGTAADSIADATPIASTSISIADIEPGMRMNGRVKSVTEFGAFVDVGVGPQGLVHISQLSRRRVDKVGDVVQVGDEVQVWVKKVDKQRGRISLTMVPPVTVHLKDLEPEMVVEGVVTRIEPYGVFVDIGTGRDGMVHISELADGYVSAPGDLVTVGERIRAKVIQVDRKARKVNLSTKDFFKLAAPEPEPEPEVAQAEEAEEEEKPSATIMELAFQASLRRDQASRRDRGIGRLIAKSLRR